MAVPLASEARIAIIAAAIPIGLWSALIVLGSIPFFQRHFLYAHRINTLFWHNVNDPTQWGFAKNQVTPFTLRTVDDKVLYAWHIMPLSQYMAHEDELLKEPSGLCGDFANSKQFKLLKDDPEAKLVIYFHGNAGHVAQGIRPANYHMLADSSSYHVLAIDYRGFGHSTGSPTEEGLIRDGVSVVNFAMTEAGVAPSRIVLLGQSLGTAVTSGVAEHFAEKSVEFAGVVLVAGFSTLPKMLSGYAIAGWIPVLAPLRVVPPLLRVFERFIVDKWDSAARLAAVVRLTRQRLRLTLVHAKNDWDIPCHEDDKLFAAAANATSYRGLDAATLAELKDARTVVTGKNSFVTTWKAEPNIIIRQELFPHGGHNDIMLYSPVMLAVRKAFEL